MNKAKKIREIIVDLLKNEKYPELKELKIGNKKYKGIRRNDLLYYIDDNYAYLDNNYIQGALGNESKLNENKIFKIKFNKKVYFIYDENFKYNKNKDIEHNENFKNLINNIEESSKQIGKILLDISRGDIEVEKKENLKKSLRIQKIEMEKFYMNLIEFSSKEKGD